MSSSDNIEMQGIINEVLYGGKFKVDSDGQEIIAHLSGKMRLNKIKIVLGDKVTVEVSPYDPTRGRITRRKWVNY